MIININGGGGKKQNMKVLPFYSATKASPSSTFTLPYAVNVGFKPTWIIMSGYQNSSSGGHACAEYNVNGTHTYLNSTPYTTTGSYQPYAITEITNTGFNFIKNPNINNSITTFGGSFVIVVGDGDFPEELNLIG